MAIWTGQAPSTAVPSQYSSYLSLTLFCSVKAHRQLYAIHRSHGPP